MAGRARSGTWLSWAAGNRCPGAEDVSGGGWQGGGRGCKPRPLALPGVGLAAQQLPREQARRQAEQQSPASLGSGFHLRVVLVFRMRTRYNENTVGPDAGLHPRRAGRATRFPHNPVAVGAEVMRTQVLDPPAGTDGCLSESRLTELLMILW